MKISVVGLGYIGLPLAKTLSSGHEVSGTTTSPEKLEQDKIKVHLLESPALPDNEILDCDVLVLNIPPSDTQPQWFRNWNLGKTKKIIFVSSTSAPRNETLQAEEAWVKELGIPWLIVRPGGLLGNGRHPGKSLSGRKGIKARLSPVNLIHADDVVGFIVTAIEKNLTGETISLVSDEHHTKEEFYSEFCRRNGLPLPEFDQNDLTVSEIVPNDSMKKHYALKFPTMLGTSL